MSIKLKCVIFLKSVVEIIHFPKYAPICLCLADSFTPALVEQGIYLVVNGLLSCTLNWYRRNI